MPLGHLGVNVPDLAAARAYYDALMPLLDHEPFVSSDTEFSLCSRVLKHRVWL